MVTDDSVPPAPPPGTPKETLEQAIARLSAGSDQEKRVAEMLTKSVCFKAESKALIKRARKALKAIAKANDALGGI